MKKALANLALKLSGWKIKGDFPQDLKQYVVLGGPHTTNWDFIIAITTVWYKKAKITILGKQELFKPPFGWVFRSLGVVPVNRQANSNAVEATAKLFEEHEELVIALSPEGTRKKVDRLRTGFYYIAKLAGVPLVFIGADFPSKTIVIHEPFYITENKDADFEKIREMFSQFKGLKPEQGYGYKP